jgi:dCTP diphosphatase
MDINKIQEKLAKFAQDRDWQKFHTPKNLAMALSVEAAELLEIFQWSNSAGLDEIADPKARKQIAEEIADIFNYLLKLVDTLNLDLEKISLDKIASNEQKYPIDKVKSKAVKYTDL